MIARVNLSINARHITYQLTSATGVANEKVSYEHLTLLSVYSRVWSWQSQTVQHRAITRMVIGTLTASILVTFRVSRRRREMYIGHAHLSVCVCLCVCLSLAAFPHYSMDPDVTWVPFSCALFGGFAVGSQVVAVTT